jgi:hypothetical protein
MEAPAPRLAAFHSIAAIGFLLGGNFAATAVHAAPRISYVPGISILPDVIEPDGVTPRTYLTPAGLSYWTSDLPIPRGDKIKLNVFVATGGADLKRMIIRLDNSKIAELDGSHWNTIVDTSTLASGYHMVEAWAQTTGDKPQASTKTLTFYVVDTLPVTYAVKASQELLQTNSSAGPATVESAPTSTIMPAFIANRPVDSYAAVIVRSTDQEIDTAVRGSAPVTVGASSEFYFQPAPGSTAIRYAYALVRDGKVVSESPSPESLSYDRLRIRRRTDTSPGVRPGPVTLLVWGIDQIGRPSEPARRDLVIDGEEGAR